MYTAIPFFLSVREQHPPLTYGLFLDSPALTEFDLGATQPTHLTFGVGAGDGALTYYFFAGYWRRSHADHPGALYRTDRAHAPAAALGARQSSVPLELLSR